MFLKRCFGVIEMPAVYVIIFAVLGLLVWVPSGFVRSNGFIGEAFEAYHGGLNLERFGWRWAGLQDEATSDLPDCHPYLYIHHPNFGLYVSWFLRTVGIESFEAQNAMSVLGYLAGLLVGFWALKYATGSHAAGLVYLALCSLDYWSAANVAFNIHRAFGPLSIVATIGSYRKWLDTRHLGWLAAFAVACVALVGADYLFFFVTGLALITATILGFSRVPLSRLDRLKGVAAVGCVTGGIFLIRQLQVATGLGWEMWKRDFVFQVLNRFHLQAFFRGDWDRETVDFYQGMHVLNPGFSHHLSWGYRWHSFTESLGRQFNAYVLGDPATPWDAALKFGILLQGLVVTMIVLTLVGSFVHERRIGPWARRATTYLSAAVTVLFGVGLVIGFWKLTHHHHEMMARHLLRGACLVLLPVFIYSAGIVAFQANPEVDGWEPMRTMGVLAVSLVTACLIMYAVFPWYFTTFFPSFNLMASCLMIWITTLAVPVFHAAWRQQRMGFLLAFLVLLKIGVAIPHIAELPEGLGEYASTMRDLKGRVVVSNFTPASVSTYTRTFSASLTHDGMRNLADGRALNLSDYYLLCERHVDPTQTERPDYFVHFPLSVFGPAPPEALELLRHRYPTLKRTRSFEIFDLRHWSSSSSAD
ncbi:hypothetical protein AYO40_01965 [Planctomycetaceae bacterium SCGC AG-212-D15]|nr:hypothetical protein AYO40_01965 [Planctomycetaceae bacterium SCGC AG-212-D15]